MTEMNTSDLPLEDKLAYATVVASMAAADDILAPAEIQKIRALCKALELPDARVEEVVLSAKQVIPSAVAEAIAHLRDSDLRFTLFADCVRLAWSDERVLPSEEHALAEVARELQIPEERVKAIRKAVAAEQASARSSHAVSDAAHEMAAVGVPAGAVAVASAAGLSSAGVIAATGLGMVTGVGAAVGLGIGTVLGVRWLHHRLARSRKDGDKQFEYMHQNSTLTLQEGYDQFHASIPGLVGVGEKPLSSERATELFRLHDYCHVVFGCDTSLGNEGLVDTWSIFGTDVPAKEYVEYSNVPEAKELFTEVGYMRGLLESIKDSPKLFEVFLRARAMTKKWPFHTGPDQYRDWRLVDIREEFGIQLI